MRGVFADEPVEVEVDRFPGEAGAQERALGHRERRAVRAPVVDRLVAGAAEQLVLIGVAEDLQGGGVEEGDSSRGVDNVQGVGGGRDGTEERLRILCRWSRDHAFIVARWPSDRPAGPTPGGLLAAATPPAASRNVGRVTDRRRSWRWRR